MFGHSETERPVLPVVAEQLREKLPSLKITISRADRAPAFPV